MLAQTRVIKILIIMIRVSKKKDRVMEANEYKLAIAYIANVMYFSCYFYIFDNSVLKSSLISEQKLSDSAYISNIFILLTLLL